MTYSNVFASEASPFQYSQDNLEFFVGVLYVGSSVICFISYVITSILFTYQEFNHIFQEYSINFQGGDTIRTNNLGLQFFFYISLLVLCYLITFPLLLVV